MISSIVFKFLLVIKLFSIIISTTFLKIPSAQACSSGCNSTYEHIIVSGLPFDRGFSHGQQAKGKIESMIAHYKSSKTMPPWPDCVKFVVDNYIPALKVYYPSGLEEMRGIAKGAGVEFNDILILNSRYDLSRWRRWQNLGKLKTPTRPRYEDEACNSTHPHPHPSVAEVGEECTGAVILKSASSSKSDIFLGQNWDTNEFILRNDTAILLEVHPSPCENIKPFVTLTEAGQLVRSGMNADGLGIVAMSLWSSDEVYERDLNSTLGWVPASLLRRMFLESPTFPLGIKALLQTPRHVSMNVIIATGEDEALNIEITPTALFSNNVSPDKEFLTHSNHFLSSAFKGKDLVREGSRGSSSLFRNRRLYRHLLKKWPNIREGDLREAFKDHVGYPNAVCEHAVDEEVEWTSSHPREGTVASVIYKLSSRTLSLCKGPPCMGTFHEMRFPFSIQSESD